MATEPKTKKAAPLAGELATTGNGRDITRPYVMSLEQSRDTRLLYSVDWGIYDAIRKDDQVKSCMAQRIGAVVSAEWDVLAGDDKDPRSVKAAEALKDDLSKIGWDRVTEKMLWATFYGYQVAEIIWEATNGRITFAGIKVRHARRFRFDKDHNLRLLTRATTEGELLPDRKFWVLRAGATNDDELYGEGLADWLYWPTLFKRNGIRFWNIFLDKFGTPTAKATYRRGTPQSEINKIIAALQAIATDSGIAVPEGVAIELLQAAKSGTADFGGLAHYMDEAITKVILSQTMTTQNGSSLSQAQVHAGVKMEIVKADADLACDSFNLGPARWWTDINFGTDVAAPIVVRLVDEEADLNMLAETDKILGEQGWVRTEESFRDSYGDGYERKPEPAPVVAATGPLGADPAVDGKTPPAAAPKPTDAKTKPPVDPASFAAIDPRPLYVYRSLENAGALIAWAKKQGFVSTLPANEMHVTVAYSKRAVNWFAIPSAWSTSSKVTVGKGGARAVAKLGDEGAVVLHFVADDLAWRHKEICDAGASWDFPGYLPHVTISYDGSGIDLEKIVPYTGELVFGPEIFEPIDDDWTGCLNEVSFAELAANAAPTDIVDEVAIAMLEQHGWKPLSTVMQAIITALEASDTPGEFDRALLDLLPTSDREAAAQIIARAGFAIRIDGETGGGQ